jgi:hypothetical protein
MTDALFQKMNPTCPVSTIRSYEGSMELQSKKEPAGFGIQGYVEKM